MTQRTREYAREFGLEEKSFSNAGDGDAFRHATASALMTCKVGPVAAAALGAGYEIHNFADWIKKPFGQESQSLSGLAKESLMDLYNDFQGIQNNLCRENLSEHDIASRTAEQTKAGKFLVIREGRFEKSGTTPKASKGSGVGPRSPDAKDTKKESKGPSDGPRRGSQNDSKQKSPTKSDLTKIDASNRPGRMIA